MPNPPRIAVFPLPQGSQATPRRGPSSDFALFSRECRIGHARIGLQFSIRIHKIVRSPSTHFVPTAREFVPQSHLEAEIRP